MRPDAAERAPPAVSPELRAQPVRLVSGLPASLEPELPPRARPVRASLEQALELRGPPEPLPRVPGWPEPPALPERQARPEPHGLRVRREPPGRQGPPEHAGPAPERPVHGAQQEQEPLQAPGASPGPRQVLPAASGEQ